MDWHLLGLILAAFSFSVHGIKSPLFWVGMAGYCLLLSSSA